MSDSLNSRPALMLAMLMVAVFFAMGSRAVFSPIMPAIQDSFNISLTQAGGYFLLISISYAIAMILSGFLAASLGHGRTIVTALSCIAVGLMVAASAPGPLVLGGGVVLIGAGSGAYPPSGLVMINATFPIEKRSTAFALHEIGPSLALLVVPLLVLAIEPWFGWRGVLVWMSVICSCAAVAFLRWGAGDSGVGAAPDISTIKNIVFTRPTLLGMVILSATLAGVQGVYSILPAFLVKEYSFSPQYVNVVLTLSRVTGILALLRAGQITRYYGRRKTITGVLIFSGLFTGLLGIVHGTLMISVVTIIQPTFLAVLIPALLSSIGEIGETRYQNLTYSVVITIGVTFGGGVAPALLGLCGDLGFGGLGFVSLGGMMGAAVLLLLTTPDFGK